MCLAPGGKEKAANNGPLLEPQVGEAAAASALLRPVGDQPGGHSDEAEAQPDGHTIALSPRGHTLQFVQRPEHLVPGSHLPELSEPSRLLGDLELRCLAEALPERFKHHGWSLVYSTLRHGVSLSTLYRKAVGRHPCILVVDDTAGYVFGAFLTESIKVSSRYYGTGESFVFQAKPHAVAYKWSPHMRNRTDFFVFGSVDSLAVGGGGHFAIWLDQELARGTSTVCSTFGNPCLACAEEFKIMNVELWALD